MIETTQIDKRMTLDIEYTYHEGQPAIGSPTVVQAEPAMVEIHSIKVEGATILYNKDLWNRLSERVMEDYV